MDEISNKQNALCARFGVSPLKVLDDDKLGFAVIEGELPIHGLRHLPANGTSGWYIWTGELRQDVKFFSPMHHGHLKSECPLVLQYLALPPGSRFIVTPDYEDIWFDDSIVYT